MKKFLIKLGFALALPLMIGFFDIYSNYYLNDTNYYKIDNSIHILILGNSHSECSLNDSIIDHSINLSHGAESYFYTYFKLNKLVNANPNIHTLILEYSDYIFSDIMNKWTYGEEFLGKGYPMYSHIIPLKDKFYLFTQNPHSFLIAFKDAIILKFRLIFSSHEHLYSRLDWGDYRPSGKNISSNLKTTIKPTIPIKNNVLYVFYLEKIVELCKVHNIEIIFLRSPITLYNQIYMKNNATELIKLYHSKFSDIRLWDYSKYPMERTEFVDAEHLNYKGATKFSFLIKNKLNQLNSR